MNRLLALVAALLATLPLSFARAAELQEPSTGLRFALEQKVDGSSFACLGVGVRKVFLFKAYAVTYCLGNPEAGRLIAEYVAQKHPGRDPESLAEALQEDPAFFELLTTLPGDRLVILRAVRDLPREKIAQAFEEGLEGVVKPAQIAQLIDAIPGDIASGEKATLVTHGSKLTIDVAGKRKTLDDAAIVRNLWRVWLGRASVSPTLKVSIARRASGLP